MRRGFVQLAVPVLVALSASVSAQERPAPAADGSRHFIWSVRQGEGAPCYLVGSLHVLDKASYPLPTVFADAFGASKVLIGEVDLDDMESAGAASALARGVFTDGRSLADVVSEETYTLVQARAEAAGIPMMMVGRMKPWLAAATLATAMLQRAGVDPSFGIDRHFFEEAQARRMESRGLETIQYQLERLDGMSAADQEGMLATTLRDLDNQLASFTGLAEQWKRGDTTALETTLLDAFRQSPALYDRLLVERNRNWMETVEQCVRAEERCFIVVGAAHLVGRDSLVSMLAAKGYRVEQR